MEAYMVGRKIAVALVIIFLKGCQPVPIDLVGSVGTADDLSMSLATQTAPINLRQRPISNAKVVLAKDKEGSQVVMISHTGIDGRFAFKTSLRRFEGGRIWVVVSADGFEEYAFKLDVGHVIDKHDVRVLLKNTR
jgi:hypothetical protein